MHAPHLQDKDHFCPWKMSSDHGNIREYSLAVVSNPILTSKDAVWSWCLKEDLSFAESNSSPAYPHSTFPRGEGDEELALSCRLPSASESTLNNSQGYHCRMRTNKLNYATF